MATRIRNFEPNAIWSNQDGTLSERAKGFTRALTTPVEVSTAEISATAGGTYTATEQAMLNEIKALLNEIRSALASRGIIE